MRASTFDRYVTRQLCWLDGSPTHVSSARQRQCPRCRRKWSHEGLAKRWLVAQEYCTGHNRREAAQAAGVDGHTAGRYYSAFDRVLARHLRKNLKRGRAWTLAAGESSQRLAANKAKSPRQIERLAAHFCLEGLSIRRRLELIYELVFSAGVERLLRRKPVRSQ